MKVIKAVLVILIAGAALALAAMMYLDSPARPGGEPVEIEIGQGWNAVRIGGALERAGIVRSGTYFAIVAKTSGRSGALKAGTFEVSPAMSTREVVEFLATAVSRPRARRITIPEGFTAREIAGRVEEAGLCTAEKFMDIADGPERYGIRIFGRRVRSLEGYLFPETYFVDEKTTCEDLAARMTAQFQEVFSAGYEKKAMEIGFTPEQAVIMASLIEKEARVDSEREIISGVLHNRLRLGMLLQCDATIQYALPDRRERLFYKDLEIDSPYNTYKYRGLPPGPICNPGELSLRAAVQPRQHDYFYYVARSDGTHVFSRTDAEHVRAKQQIRNEMRNR